MDLKVAQKKGYVPMVSGKVKWFDPKKGYGFILHETGEDVFVHYSSIAGEGFRALKDGETVEYELVSSEKGLHAGHVKRPEQGLPRPEAGA